MPSLMQTAHWSPTLEQAGGRWSCLARGSAEGAEGREKPTLFLGHIDRPSHPQKGSLTSLSEVLQGMGIQPHTVATVGIGPILDEHGAKSSSRDLLSSPHDILLVEQGGIVGCLQGPEPPLELILSELELAGADRIFIPTEHLSGGRGQIWGLAAGPLNCEVGLDVFQALVRRCIMHLLL